jgi:hypothetical protein
MKTSSSLHFCAILCLILPIGCGTTGPEQNHSLAPNALHGQTRFALEAMDMNSMRIDEVDEKQFRATRQPQQIASWDADKVAMRENFAKAARETGKKIGFSITDTNEGTAFVIRPALISIVTGGYRPFMVSKSHVTMKLIIMDPSGKPVDEFVEESAVAFDLVGPQSSLGGRLRLAATELGSRAILHLQKFSK